MTFSEDALLAGPSTMLKATPSKGSVQGVGNAGRNLIFLRQWSEPVGLGKLGQQAVDSKGAPVQKERQGSLPALVEKSSTAISWSTPNGTPDGHWHHFANPGVYDRAVKKQKKVLPRLAVKRIGSSQDHSRPRQQKDKGHRPNSTPAPSSRKASPPPGKKLQPKQMEMELDKRIALLQDIFAAEDGAQRSTSDSPKRFLSAQRLEELSRPKKMYAEGPLPNVMGQEGAAQAMEAAAEQGLLPKKPYPRPLHIPTVPKRYQDMWDKKPPVGLAAEMAKWNQPQASPAPASSTKPKKKEAPVDPMESDILAFLSKDDTTSEPDRGNNRTQPLQLGSPAASSPKAAASSPKAAASSPKAAAASPKAAASSPKAAASSPSSPKEAVPDPQSPTNASPEPGSPAAAASPVGIGGTDASPVSANEDSSRPVSQGDGTYGGTASFENYGSATFESEFPDEEAEDQTYDEDAYSDDGSGGGKEEDGDGDEDDDEARDEFDPDSPVKTFEKGETNDAAEGSYSFEDSQG
eukprot:TRINITY_DN20443_c2_g1_i1.p1 TRINITY_DN20443_c2_g1~~TRINITY_DN20443_c2_g1_i1.p1  ORF type:complete len:520 (+),score=144.56 TRINITY_DN20443_c2_g1_i1:59-1618(+)